MHCLQTFKERFRLQDHALAAAERAVIHAAVFVFRERPQVVDFNFRQTHLAGPAGDAVLQRSAKEVRKDRDDVGLHFVNQNLNAEDAEDTEEFYSGAATNSYYFAPAV